MRRALTAVVVCLALVACGDSTAPPVATSLEASSAVSQTGTAGKLVPEAPSFVVRDQNGNAMAGVPVSVSVTGGGTIASMVAQSSGGPTSIGQWTLGQAAGPNSVQVNVAGLPTLTFTAQGVPGPLAGLKPVGSLSLVGRIGGTISPGPSVVVSDEFDNPIGGIEVTVEPSAGSTVGVATIVSEANGTARVSSWTLGSSGGDYTLTLSAGGFVTEFTATAHSGPPTSLTVVTGGNQTVPAATVLPAPLTIRVLDEFGSNVNLENVGFTVIAGGGSLSAGSATSDANGLVTAPQWTMGKSDVPQMLRVTAGPVSIDVTAQIATQFDITLRFPGTGMTAAREAVFARAAQRLQGIITGDLPDLTDGSLDMGPCGFPGMSEGPVDDVVIYAAIVPIDGPGDSTGNVLGQAGPCWFRGPGLGFPLTGIMRFDEFDIANIEAQGRLEDVILHEMLHVLGVGSYWPSIPDFGWPGFLHAPSSLDVRYVGPLAREECLGVGGGTVCANSVPVESCTAATPPAEDLVCRAGSVNAHWRESTFGNELMSPLLNAGGNHLSAMTIGALADLGYVVNYAARDGYGVPSPGILGNLLPGSGLGARWEEILRPLGIVDPSGKATLLPTSP